MHYLFSAQFRARLGLLSAGVVFLSAMAVLLAGARQRPAMRAAQPGSLAQNFRLCDLAGNSTTLLSLRGKVVVVCINPRTDLSSVAPELDRLSELSTQYASQRDVRVLLIQSNTEDLNQAELHQFKLTLAETKCATLLDPTGYVAQLYRLEVAPTFFILDASGVIRYRGGLDDTSPERSVTSSSFSNLIDLLLSEKPLAASPTQAVLGHIK